MASTRKVIRFVPLLGCLALTAGCGFPMKEGRIYPVVGLGFVRVSREHPETRKPDVKAERIDVRGAVVAANPAITGLVIGQLHRQTITVDPNANLIVESKTDSNGRLHVDVKPPLIETTRTNPIENKP